MNIQDPISDMFARINNALKMQKKTVAMPHTKIKKSISKVLLDAGYISDFQVEGDKKPTLIIYLKYYQGKPVISMLKRVSLVSRRLYRGVRDLPKVMNGLGIAIISTSKGVCSDQEARKVHQGGEVLGLVA